MENFGREPKDHPGVPVPGMIHSFSCAPRRFPVPRPIFLYPYQTRAFQRALPSQKEGVNCNQELPAGNLPIIQDQGPVSSIGCYPWGGKNQQWMFGYNSFPFLSLDILFCKIGFHLSDWHLQVFFIILVIVGESSITIMWASATTNSLCNGGLPLLPMLQ